MAAPNIEMIAASLSRCSLGRDGRGPAPQPQSSSPSKLSSYDHRRRRRRRRRPLAEASDESSGVTVELNSETALPLHWQQCLDMRTGEIYYVNSQTGSRTAIDPRTTSPLAASDGATCKRSYFYSGDEETSGSYKDSCSGVRGGNGGGYECDDSADSSSITTLSSPSVSDASSAVYGGASSSGQVLVAAGCKTCFMYFMVPKHVHACPQCGASGLLHLGLCGGNVDDD